MKKIAAFIASGTGMGADAAKHLHSKGYNIAIMSSSGKGEKLANQLGGLGFTGSNLISKDINYFIEKVYKNFGKITSTRFRQECNHLCSKGCYCLTKDSNCPRNP